MPLKQPHERVLCGYAFDPGFSTRLTTYTINTARYRIRWEEHLRPGPIGEYVEVLDFDPASNRWYAPVDLNAPAVLADHGLRPNEGDPMFHQQLVYAVAMKTIGHFEEALGRRIIWHPRVIVQGPNDREESRLQEESTKSIRYQEEYVGALRIYPHGLRARNAYFSPNKAAILLGYFPATSQVTGNNFPGGAVFTCLSPDIVAHEVTHAILHSIHPSYLEGSNRDVLAFHEGFSDLVALFQRFTFSEVVEHQIAMSRGNLGDYTLLGELATQFGEALRGRRGALRGAIGYYDEKSKTWVKHDPDPERYMQAEEAHERGAVLVAAVFDAYLRLYQHQTRDLVRIATGGTGRLPEGDLHPDLVKRMAGEANQLAVRFLSVIIRALDYSPPMDITFGEFLRALITADTDLMPNEREAGCRIALIEAFREWGIYPEKVNALSVSSLVWHKPSQSLETLANAVMSGDPAIENDSLWPALSELATIRDPQDREKLYVRARELRAIVHQRLKAYLFDNPNNTRSEERRELGMIDSESLVEELESTPSAIEADITTNGRRSSSQTFQIHSLYPVLRGNTSYGQQTQLIVTIHQRLKWYIESRNQEFYFRGGATLVFDMSQQRLAYVIRKRISSSERFEKQVRYQLLESAKQESALANKLRTDQEPFAVVHSGLLDTVKRER